MREVEGRGTEAEDRYEGGCHRSHARDNQAAFRTTHISLIRGNDVQARFHDLKTVKSSQYNAIEFPQCSNPGSPGSRLLYFPGQVQMTHAYIWWRGTLSLQVPTSLHIDVGLDPIRG
jgi:hypothetical protein